MFLLISTILFCSHSFSICRTCHPFLCHFCSSSHLQLQVKSNISTGLTIYALRCTYFPLEDSSLLWASHTISTPKWLILRPLAPELQFYIYNFLLGISTLMSHQYVKSNVLISLFSTALPFSHPERIFLPSFPAFQCQLYSLNV